MTEPVACGVHAIRHCWTARDDGRIDGVKVTVVGAGMLGLGAILAAKWLGADSVTAVARYPHQAATAEMCGADEVLQSDEPDLQRVLRSRRPDLVVEAVGGDAPTMDLVTDVAAWRGEVVVLGSFTHPKEVDLGRLGRREVRLFIPVAYSSRDGLADFDVALQLLEGKGAPLADLITHRFALDEIGEAFATASDKTSQRDSRRRWWIGVGVTRIRDIEHRTVDRDEKEKHCFNQASVRVLQNGDVVAVYNEERFPIHHDSGQTVFLRSSDGGETWSERTVVLPFDETTGNWDCGIAELADGTLLVNFTMAGYFKRGIKPEQPSWAREPMTEEWGDWTWSYRLMSWLGTYVVRSDDGGRTWSLPYPVNARPLKHAGCRIGCWPMPTGEILMGVYGRIHGYGEEGEGESTRRDAASVR